MSMKIDSDKLNLIQNKYSYLTNYQSDDPTDPIDPINYRDSGGDGLLHIAAMKGDNDTISILIEHGIDPNMLGDMSYTALHYAAECNHPETVKLLLSYGARRDLRNEFGKEPNIKGVV